MHEMRLDEKWFKLINNGKKTVEGRINDEKRKLINIGDQIKFINRNNNQEFVIKYVKNKKLFPKDDSVFKSLYLAIDYLTKKWSMPVRYWSEAMPYFAIEFEDRIQRFV